MRVAIDNGNGMACDNCGKLVRAKSKDMIKCMCVTPHPDAVTDKLLELYDFNKDGALDIMDVVILRKQLEGIR